MFCTDASEATMQAVTKDASHLLELLPGDQDCLMLKQGLQFRRSTTLHEEASKELAVDSSNAEALMKRGRTSYELGHHADAVVDLSRYLEMSAPKQASASVYSDLGSALLYLQSPVQALPRLQHSTTLRPNHAFTLFQCGLCCAALGRLRDAGKFDSLEFE